MVTLLAVETSGSLCSLAIHRAGRWLEDTQNVERLHNQVVLANLDALVTAARLDRRSIDVVAFGAGPGSFTGIRIAAAVCQGIAYGCGASVVPVSSSLALAAALGEADGARRIVTVTRSRRDAYYLAAFDGGAPGEPVRRRADSLHLGDAVPADLAEGTGVGDRPSWWPPERPFVDDVAVTARVVGELALAAAARGDTVSPAAALPVYIAGDSPWRPARSG